MKKFLYISALILFIAKPIINNAQLVVNGSIAPNQLVVDNFVWGGVLVDTVIYTGPAFCIGSFNGNSNLGMTHGVVMSTGNSVNVPNPSSFFLSNSLGGAGDPLLSAISGGYTSYDAVILEFDFVPFSTPVMFDYVFGSEEYPEYVCSNFNDVFGFFVTGPNPLGGNYTNLNVALIPGTNLPVTISSVNPGVPGAYGTSGDCTSLAYSQYYVTNTGSTVCFDGFTTPFLASFDVVPFQQYHIKLAISDIGDGAYDSGVFLKNNSFFTNAVKLETSNTVPNNGNKAIEGCSTGIFKFSIHDTAAQNDTVFFTIDGSAVNGVDYDFIPSYVIIPAGSDSTILEINAHSDGINEGNETIILHVQVSPYGTQDISLNISDSFLFNATAGLDQTICNGQSVTLTASGGINYEWNTTDTTESINVSPIISTTYSVQISDSIGCVKTDSIHVTVEKTPVSGFDFVDNGQGQISFTDQSLNGTSWYWDFGNGTYSTNQNPGYVYSIQGNYQVEQIVFNTCGSDTTYQIISILLNISENIDSREFLVYPNPNDGNFNILFPSNCEDAKRIELTNSFGNIIFTREFPSSVSEQIISIKKKDVSKGEYFLKVICGENIKSTKVIVN